MNVAGKGVRVFVRRPTDGFEGEATLLAFHPSGSDVTAPGEYSINVDCPDHPEGHNARVPEAWVTFLESGTNPN